MSLLGLVGVLAAMLAVAHRHQPLGTWLIWQYAALWLLCGFVGASCVSAGTPIVRACLGDRLPLGRHVLFSFAAGLWIFATGVFLAGLFGALRGWFFYIWPSLLLLLGARSCRRHFVPRWSRWHRLRHRVGKPRMPWAPALWAFGLLGLLLVYVPILTPGNIAYDSRWYHLGVAEHYATAGRIAPFVEGWFHGTLPQFASWLYTWALLWPGATLFLRTELAAHLEFFIFLATLVGVSLLVRQQSGGTLRRGGWVATFLFPGLFLYDSNLSLAADHVLAFWAPALALLVPHVLSLRARGAAILLGLFAGAAVLVKYQVIYLLAGGALLLVLEFASRQRRAPLSLPAPKQALRALGIAALVALLATSSHWLRNWLWYGNPVYPLAQALFGGDPWIEGTVPRFEDPGWMPVGNLLERVLETIGGTFSFSLVPHDWKRFHGRIPVFGALFPLLLLPALPLSGLGRTWRLAAATLLGVLVWYATYHQDRYLQSLLPWMAAVVAVILAQLWQARVRSLQVALAAVLGFQLAWSADVPFLPTHAMAGKSPFELSLKLASSTYRKAWDERSDMHSKLPKVAAALPPREEGEVLLHEEHLRFGLGRPVIVDGRGRQGVFDYHRLATPQAVHEALRAKGISHVIWSDKPRGLMNLTDDLVFHDFIRKDSDEVPTKERKLARLRQDTPAPEAPASHVVFVTCAGTERVPWDEVQRRWKRHFRAGCETTEVSFADVAEATRGARFVVMDEDLSQPETVLEPGWTRLFTFKGVVAFSRRLGS